MNTAGHTPGSHDQSAGNPSQRFSGRGSTYRISEGQRPVGYAALMERYGIYDYQPPHVSYVSAKAFAARSREEISPGRGIRELFPGRTAVGESDAEHLAFAMRYDGVDLEMARRVMPCIDSQSLTTAIKETPNSAFLRRAWCLYEWITGKELPIAGIEKLRLSSVPLLDPQEHVTADQGISRRHGVRMNLLGSRAWCPQILRTAAVEAALTEGPLELRDRIRTTISGDEAKRINQFLVTEETWGSFAIEGERPTADRSQRFYDLLERATARPTLSISEEFLSAAQRGLMETPSFKDGQYRGEQVWIGHREQGVGGIRAKVQYIAPKYEDLPELMGAFLPVANQLVSLTASGAVHPVISASAISSGFVYLHPYVDGNGRLSRVLLQHALAAGDPQEHQRILIPVSAAIEREKQRYYDTLSVVSRHVMKGTRYLIDERGQIAVSNDTKDLYRYPDLTDMTAYLGERIRTAVEHDLVEERQIMKIYDHAQPDLERISQLPSKELDLFFRICKQNGWAMSANKRGRFGALSDEQVAQMESVLRESATKLNS